MEKFLLQVLFKNKPATPKEYISTSKEILMELEQVHPIFEDLFGWGHEPDSRQGFKPDKNNFEEVVFEQIRDEKVAYINEDPDDKAMHWDSKLWKHFGNSYSNTTNVKEGKVSVDIDFGSTNNDIGIFNIKFPTYNYPEFSDFDFVKNLLETCLTFFEEVEYAVVISNKFRREVKQKGQPFWIGWMTYINNEQIYKELPAQSELPGQVTKEQMAGGTFFSLCQPRPTSEDEPIVKKALQIRDLLAPKGYLNYPNHVETF